MNIGFSKMTRTGMVALALLTGGSSVSLAAPYGAVSSSSVQSDRTASTNLPVINVRDGRIFRRGGDGGHWRGGGNGYGRDGWRNNGWRRDGGWRRGGWRDNDGWRGHRRGNYYGSAAVLGLGLGLLAAPRYYDAAPRRVYRTVGGSHVQWCYNRYRSYRAYDNSFQPYNGPRQQCYSPY